MCTVVKTHILSSQNTHFTIQNTHFQNTHFKTHILPDKTHIFKTHIFKTHIWSNKTHISPDKRQIRSDRNTHYKTEMLVSDKTEMSVIKQKCFLYNRNVCFKRVIWVIINTNMSFIQNRHFGFVMCVFRFEMCVLNPKCVFLKFLF